MAQLHHHKLRNLFDISGSPVVVILSSDGRRVATQSGRLALRASDYPWQPAAGLEPAGIQLAAMIGLFAVWIVIGASVL